MYCFCNVVLESSWSSLVSECCCCWSNAELWLCKAPTYLCSSSEQQKYSCSKNYSSCSLLVEFSIFQSLLENSTTLPLLRFCVWTGFWGTLGVSSRNLYVFEMGSGDSWLIAPRVLFSRQMQQKACQSLALFQLHLPSAQRTFVFSVVLRILV